MIGDELGLMTNEEVDELESKSDVELDSDKVQSAAAAVGASGGAAAGGAAAASGAAKA
ncbi:MAG: hypothetical protein K5744_12710 [Eubacterium sp.]|nr:hypothetical protein [Eubacterium sp.]